MAPQVVVMVSPFLACVVGFRLGTPTPWRVRSACGSGLAHFHLTLEVVILDSLAVAHPLDLPLWTPMPWSGPWSWGHARLCLSMDLGGRVLGTCNPRLVAWPLELGSGTNNPRFVAWPLKFRLATRNPRLFPWPLEEGLGTHNPRFVAWPLALELVTRSPRIVAWPPEVGLGARFPRLPLWPLEMG